ncbi:uncharacterized protein LOC142351464 isoform X2 [Convolutriloba macropyga]|uniref:uncharacterized protein LOC142351464 isoform X2 n=1 Tax=Convolutriloba macropyga TaxID=536237 RepID=UPI003F52729E
MVTNQQQTTNSQSRLQPTNVGETSPSVTGKTSAPPTQAYTRQFPGQGQPNYPQTNQGQTTQGQFIQGQPTQSQVSQGLQQTLHPTGQSLGQLRGDIQSNSASNRSRHQNRRIQAGGAFSARGLTQRQLESLEMSLLDNKDEIWGTEKISEPFVQNSSEINYRENEKEWSCTIYFPNLKYRLPNGLDWSKTSDGGFVVTSEETSSIPVDIPSYINPDHVEVIESQGTAELLFRCELIPPEHEVDSGNSGQSGIEQPRLTYQNQISSGSGQNGADPIELLNSIPSEARTGEITEDENMQFVEKLDENNWEAILVRNDMNMDQATFESDNKGNWGVYDGTIFHQILLPDGLDPKHVVVMPEGEHKIRIIGLIQNANSYNLSEFKEYILYRQNLAAAARQDKPQTPYPNWQPQKANTVARRPEGTFGVNNRSDKLQTMPEFFGFQPADLSRQPRTTRDTLEDDFVEFLERSDGQLWEARLTHSGMDMNNIKVDQFDERFLILSVTGKVYEFEVPEGVDYDYIDFQRHGPSTLLIFGTINSHLPSKRKFDNAIQKQSLNLDWKSDRPLSATIDDQMELLGPVLPGYESKMIKAYSKAQTAPKYPEALVRIDSFSDDSIWEAIVGCTLFNHNDVALVRLNEAAWVIQDFKHNFLVNLDIPPHIDPDTVAMETKEDTHNLLHRIVNGIAYVDAADD